MTHAISAVKSKKADETFDCVNLSLVTYSSLHKGRITVTSGLGIGHKSQCKFYSHIAR